MKSAAGFPVDQPYAHFAPSLVDAMMKDHQAAVHALAIRMLGQSAVVPREWPVDAIPSDAPHATLQNSYFTTKYLAAYLLVRSCELEEVEPRHFLFTNALSPLSSATSKAAMEYAKAMKADWIQTQVGMCSASIAAHIGSLTNTVNGLQTAQAAHDKYVINHCNYFNTTFNEQGIRNTARLTYRFYPHIGRRMDTYEGRIAGRFQELENTITHKFEVMEARAHKTAMEQFQRLQRGIESFLTRALAPGSSMSTADLALAQTVRVNPYMELSSSSPFNVLATEAPRIASGGCARDRVTATSSSASAAASTAAPIGGGIDYTASRWESTLIDPTGRNRKRALQVVVAQLGKLKSFQDVHEAYYMPKNGVQPSLQYLDSALVRWDFALQDKDRTSVSRLRRVVRYIEWCGCASTTTRFLQQEYKAFVSGDFRNGALRSALALDRINLAGMVTVDGAKRKRLGMATIATMLKKNSELGHCTLDPAFPCDVVHHV